MRRLLALLTGKVARAPAPAPAKPQYDARSRALLEAAAQAGDAHAMTTVGFIYDAGLVDGKRDYAIASAWYRKAAALGETRAMLNLGNLYRLGHGVAADRYEALNWFRRAEEAGDPDGAKAAAELR